MRGKSHNFNDYIANTTNNIICCAETHFDAHTLSEPFTAGTNFLTTRKDRRSHGGDVAIFHDESLNFVDLHYPEMETLEAIAIINKSHIISVAYWPPHGSSSTTDDLQSIASILQPYMLTHQIIVLGDFNFSGVTWAYDPDESPYLIPDVIAAKNNERRSTSFMKWACIK